MYSIIKEIRVKERNKKSVIKSKSVYKNGLTLLQALNTIDEICKRDHCKNCCPEINTVSSYKFNLYYVLPDTIKNASIQVYPSILVYPVTRAGTYYLIYSLLEDDYETLDNDYFYKKYNLIIK